MMALSPIFNNGLGVVSVRGLKRSPLPPAINTTSTGSNVLYLERLIMRNILLSPSNKGI